MASPIQAQVILCDAAVADWTGKLHMLGAGWSVTGSPTALQAVAVLIKVPWDRANTKIPLVLQLVDSDGKPVVLQGQDGPQRIERRHQLEVGRPPGLAQGSPIDAAFALSVQPLPLAPGRYQWNLDLAGERFDASFEVRAVTG